MRFWAVGISSLCLSSIAFADRVITVPTGRNLPVGSVKFEYNSLANGASATNRFLAFTPIKGFELEIHNHNGVGNNGNVTADFAYNLIAPVSSVSPGISIGVMDAFGETTFGRRPYLAFSFRELLNVGDTGAHGEVSIGIQFGSINTGFVGANIPLSKRLRLLADHNGFVLSAGLELQVHDGIKLRALTQESALYFGVALSRRF